MAKYRMTPKRRAALAKAQKASARKRRRTRNKRIGVGLGIAGTIGVAGVLGYASRSYIRKTIAGGPKTKLSKSKELDVIRVPLRLTPAKGRRKGLGFNFESAGKPFTHGDGLPSKYSIESLNKKFAGEIKAYERKKRYKARRSVYDEKRRAGLIPGYEKKVRSKYAVKTSDGSGMSARTQRRRKAKRG